ncbi:CPBP family intramembrane glutamic endopeptidase [Anaerosporobacter sp.]
MLVILSCLLFGIKQCIFLIVPRTGYSDRMASMLAMTLITICILILARKLKIRLSVFPPKFTSAYVCFTVIATILLIATPSNYTGGFKAVSLLVYGSIVTPIFEELIFRGYVWNKLNLILINEWITYIISTILFGLWHFGYISSIAFRVQDGLLNIMIWKVITGLCYGIVLGIVRLKTKNCYSTMILHGVMNMFGK